jgi:hypothetical protein
VPDDEALPRVNSNDDKVIQSYFRSDIICVQLQATVGFSTLVSNLRILCGSFQLRNFSVNAQVPKKVAMSGAGDLISMTVDSSRPSTA